MQKSANSGHSKTALESDSFPMFEKVHEKQKGKRKRRKGWTTVLHTENIKARGSCLEHNVRIIFV